MRSSPRHCAFQATKVVCAFQNGDLFPFDEQAGIRSKLGSRKNVFARWQSAFVALKNGELFLSVSDLQRIRKLIWLYFWLLLFEGALRKWVAPSLANPLLLVRDPVAVAIYYYACRERLLSGSVFLLVGGVLAWMTVAAAFLTLQDTSALQTLAVTFYGFHANFLHLPMILVMARCLRVEDVKKFGYWTLLLSIPFALMMALQYSSSSSAWINAGAGEDAKQIDFVKDHVRASATFSFITGPVYYFSLTAAFLIYGFFSGSQYPKWLTIGATLAVGLAAVTAGSRSLLGGVGIVAAVALLTGVALVPRLTYRTVQMACVIALIGLLLNQLPLVQDGYQRMSERIENANRSEGKGSAEGVLSVRVLGDFMAPFTVLYETPFWGEGLGTGTIVGAVVLSGSKSLYLYGNAEQELARNLIECGPVLGLAFIVLRWSIAFAVLKVALQCTMRGETLPFLLFAACGLALVNGNLGQSTVAGFGVFVAGLSLALGRNNFPDDDPAGSITA